MPGQDAANKTAGARHGRAASRLALLRGSPFLWLAVGLLHGLVYLFLIPPWQHPDEPSHFEHAWLIASRGRLVTDSDIDLNLRRALLQSMLDHDFYRGLPAPDPATWTGEQPIPGLQYAQLDEPPLYYWLAALPLGLLGGFPLEIQMYGARLVSLGLFLMTILAAWGIATELEPASGPLRYLLPGGVALLPGLVDLMTAVNNDAAAVAAFSWFLWGCVRLFQKGFSLPAFLWVLGAAVICAFTKSTTYLAIPLAVLALILGSLRGRNWALVWSLVLAGALVLAFAALSFEDAAYWYRATSQREPTRVQTAAAPVGDYALGLVSGASTTPEWLAALNQPLSISAARNLAGKRVTLAAWVWVEAGDTAQPVEVPFPFFESNTFWARNRVMASATPAFYAFTFDLPPDFSRAWIAIEKTPGSGAPFTVLYDGILLVEGAYPADQIPQFQDPSGLQGNWGGQPFTNLIRNSSVEHSWPSLRPGVDAWLAAILPDNVRSSTLLYSILDWRGTAWYFRATARNMLETFWGRFGWGHVRLMAPSLYDVLATAVALAGVGWALRGWRAGLRPSSSAGGFLLLAMILAWTLASLRGVIFIFAASAFIPGARYAYPAVLPTLVFLGLGWREASRAAAAFLRVPARAGFYAWLAGFLILDAVSLLTIFQFYWGPVL